MNIIRASIKLELADGSTVTYAGQFDIQFPGWGVNVDMPVRRKPLAEGESVPGLEHVPGAATVTVNLRIVDAEVSSS